MINNEIKKLYARHGGYLELCRKIDTPYQTFKRWKAKELPFEIIFKLVALDKFVKPEELMSGRQKQLWNAVKPKI